MSFSIVLSKDHDGRRLDRVIRSIWPELPLSSLMKGLRLGEVRLDSVRVREPGARVCAGQELYVSWGAPGEKAKVRNWGEVPVLWRGEKSMVINKPADLLAQPDVSGGDSVITRVWGMVGEGSLGFSPAAVHRLDRNTTGVLIVALAGDSLRELERLFKERSVFKGYLAIVVGRAPEHGEIDAPILKDEAANQVQIHKSGKQALTKFKRISCDGSLSLVYVELFTGRTHQARIHLAHAGLPILGDTKYGSFSVNRSWGNRVKRPMLHAFELGFPSDLTGAVSELSGQIFRAPMPDDMQRILPAGTTTLDL